MDTDTTRWPIWDPPVTIEEAETTAYGGIARYVVPRALEDSFAHVFSPGKRGRLDADTPLDLSRSIVAAIWDDLLAQEIAYAAHPGTPGWVNPSDTQLGSCVEMVRVRALTSPHSSRPHVSTKK